MPSRAASSDALLTSWAVLGLRAAGADSPGLAGVPAGARGVAADVERRGDRRAGRAGARRPERSRCSRACACRPDGQIGETLNSTYWGVLALGRSTPATTRFMLAQQTKAGGFAWFRHGQADSNDTAAALEALRVAGVHGAPVARAVRLPAHVPASRRRLRAHARPRAPTRSRRRGRSRASSRRARSRRAARSPTWRGCGAPDGSYRYSARYVTTPVWVTSQVLAALAKKPFPLGP